MKNIVFCADGSWSHPNEVQDGTYPYQDKKPVNLDKEPGRPDRRDIDVSGTTNVFKFYDALVPSVSQQVFYDKGVGTRGSLVDHLTGGILGEGLFEKIKDGYSNIAKTCQDGDAIHLFGFSRGAYTVRCLANMISVCGLPAPDLPPEKSAQALEDSFAAYRERNPIRKADRVAKLAIDYGNRHVPIEEIGVWDTVGAMGLPGPLFSAFDRKRYGFLDTKLHPNVKAAWHAMAIDEHRESFDVTPFTGPFAPGQQVDQVWFAGTHSDVGGGTKDPALADIPLGWMMRKAASRGLEFDPLKLAKYADLPKERALDAINPSWKDLPIGLPINRTISEDATLANSVVLRMQNMPDYRPHNIRLISHQDRARHLLVPQSMQIEDVMPLPAPGRARA